MAKPKKGKIDFVASKNSQFKYIQVCFNISDDNTKLRKFSAFDEIVEGEKYIITLTKEDYSENGIKQINLFDFLMNDNF